MKINEFQKFLFRSAVCLMAVDSNVSDSEIQELSNIVKTTAYFFDFEFDEALRNNISEIRDKGKKAIEKYIEDLTTSELTEKQELILVEVLIRMIEADNIVDASKLKFFHLVKSNLKTPVEILITKFPRQVEYLIDSTSNSVNTNFDADVTLNE